ncbi:MAG: DUF2142 domain-containing protein [Ilumatobacteraceae bacterium]
MRFRRSRRPVSRNEAGGSERTGLTVAIASVALFLVGAAWSLSSAVGSSPDDGFHLTSIWCSPTAPGDACDRVGPGPEPRTGLFLVPERISDDALDCFRFVPDESAACADATTRAGAAMVGTRGNDGAYPSGFYSVLGLLVMDSVGFSVVAMRLLAWCVCCAVIGASVFAADRALRPALITAVLVTSVPLMVFISASTNPSSWAVAGSTAFFFAALAGLRAPSRGTTFMAAGIAGTAALIALISRPDGGLWLSIGAVAALSIHYRRAREFDGRGLALVTAAFAAGAFLVLFTSSSSIAQRGLNIEGLPSRPFFEVLFYNLSEVPTLWIGSLGTWALGWLDTPMPALVPTAMIGVYAGAVTIGIAQPDRRNVRSLLFLVTAAVAVPLYLHASDGSVVPQGIQARYILPVLPMVVVAALVRSHDAAPIRFTRRQSITGCAAVAIAHSLALHANIRRHVSGQDIDRFNLGDDVEWWWWSGAPSPMLVWCIGSVAGGVVIVLIGRVIRLQRAPRGAAAIDPTKPGLPIRPAVRLGANAERPTERAYRGPPRGPGGASFTTIARRSSARRAGTDRRL